MLDIIHGHLLCEGRCFHDYYVRIGKNIITSVGPMALWKPLPNVSVINARKNYISPGFIDIHNHGAFMYDAMDASFKAFDKISEYHLKNGVTSYLLTTMTAPLTAIGHVLDVLKEYVPKIPVRILGCHLEGPFLSVHNAGAHPAPFLKCPDSGSIKFLEKYKDYIKLITAAPELPHTDQLLAFCQSNGIVVSGGHDNAIDDEIHAAIDGGLKSVTHIYCCSSGMSRRPGSYKKHLGLTQIGLLHPELFCEVIADDYHVPPELFDFIYRCKGYQKICLISDGLSASGMAPGQYYLGQQGSGVPVIVDEHVALLSDKSAFAGSITSIGTMVSRLISRRTIPPEEAAYMASTAPARLLGLEHKGNIAPGFDAELNIMDRCGALESTIIGENFIYYHKEGASYEI